MKKNLKFFFWPKKNKNPKNGLLPSSFRTKSANGVLATPFDQITQKLVCIEFKGVKRDWFAKFLISGLVFFLGFFEVGDFSEIQKT